MHVLPILCEVIQRVMALYELLSASSMLPYVALCCFAETRSNQSSRTAEAFVACEGKQLERFKQVGSLKAVGDANNPRSKPFWTESLATGQEEAQDSVAMLVESPAP